MNEQPVRRRPPLAEPSGSTWRLITLGALVLAGTTAFALLDMPSPERAVEVVNDLGPLGPALFVVVSAGLTVLMFPKPILAAVAGMAFGPLWGTVLAMFGTTLGAAGAYLLSRHLGRATVVALTRGQLAQVDDWLGPRGLIAVLYARLTPVVPFGAVNYASGLSSIRLRDFVVGTCLGIIPGTFIFAALGGSIHDPSSPMFLTAVGMTLILALAAPLSRRITRRPVPSDCAAPTVCGALPGEPVPRHPRRMHARGNVEPKG